MNKPSESAPRTFYPFSFRLRPAHLLGTGLLIAAVIVLLHRVYTGLTSNDEMITGALLGGSAAALATAVGTLPLLYSKPFSQRAVDGMMGFGAGVMLAACSFSLILPALNVATSEGASSWSAGGTVAVGIILGALALFLLDRALPHEHFVKGVEGAKGRALKRAWLFVLAITLHNFPEGLAIGVGFAGPDRVGAQSLAMGIAIQDIPEGMVVAMALRAVNYSRGMAAGIGILTGLIEPLAAVIGVFVLSISTALLPWGLATAAGAMLFVISHEIIPESHRQGHEAFATGGLILGFVLMMLLDTALG